ncbi:MAG TPA: hypothetical protein VK427_12425, partial [Kofleriaceae bacterium]|nr:hypothetical protein [Kofleriaceae bacterium]
MINVAVVWLLTAAILVGWGLVVVSLFRRICGATFGGTLTAFQTLWLGYAGLLAFLQIASLIAPVNTGVMVTS